MRPADMNPLIWRSVDGHLFRSVPCTLPVKWLRTNAGLVSSGGEFEIKRIPGSSSGIKPTYDLYRQGTRIGFTMPTLKAAKFHAILSARGEDRVNVA